MHSCNLRLATQNVRSRRRRMRTLAAVLALAAALFALNCAAGVEAQSAPRIEFACIRPAAFFRGNRTEWSGRVYQNVQYPVRITRPYCLSVTEVTQAQWKSVMGELPYTYSEIGDDYPVRNVSWNGAREFLSKLNAREPGRNYRLPTLAEWELAARGPGATWAEQKNYHWGDDAEGARAYAWHYSNSSNTLQRVRRLRPSPEGVYDLYGNVWEWVADRTNQLTLRSPYKGNAALGCLDEYRPEYCYPADYQPTDPRGDPDGRFVMLAGTGFDVSQPYEAPRMYRPDESFNSTGFRIARDGR